jgi:hypothetical protein
MQSRVSSCRSSANDFDATEHETPLKVRQLFRYFFTTTISGLPAVLLPRLAPDPPGRIWSGVFARVSGLGLTPEGSLAGEEPEQRTPLFYRPRRRRSPRPALPRLDARECFGVGAKRSCGRRRGVRQTCKLRPVMLTEIPAKERAPILKAWCEVATSGRQHLPVAHDAPVSAFETIAPDYPVFRIDPAP